MKFKDVPAGHLISARGNNWHKREDGNVELLSRDLSVSFIGGRRSIQTFPEDEEVKTLTVSALYADDK